VVQVTICVNSDTLEHVTNLCSANPDVDIAVLLAQHTVDMIIKQSEHDGYASAAASSLLTEPDRILSIPDFGHLLQALWRDRKSFFELCKNGSLPGVMSLLYAIWFSITGFKASQ
jgi:hypothetical protein